MKEQSSSAHFISYVLDSKKKKKKIKKRLKFCLRTFWNLSVKVNGTDKT